MSIIATPNFGIIPSAASPGYPNEPAGSTIMTDWPTDFTAYAPPGYGNEDVDHPWGLVFWAGDQGPKDDFEHTLTVTDNTAPLEKTTVGETRFTAANTGAATGYGNSPEKPISYSQLKLPSPQSNYKLYISWWWKAMPGFELLAGQLKFINLWSEGTVTPAMSASGDGGHLFPSLPPYHLEFYSTDWPPNRTCVEQTNGPNELYNNIWYQFEWLIDWGTHKLKAWVDGNLSISGTPTCWPQEGSGSYAEFSWDWTYGGNYDPPGLAPPWPGDMYTRMTHLRVSRSASGA